MVFNSLEFFIFFPAVLIMYFALPENGLINYIFRSMINDHCLPQLYLYLSSNVILPEE